ncbi:MAG: DUF368 domain-containing protein [Candidatus Omnitrophota bacterium]|nr:DUF368 domain-containing protein [Candidatus Omnitrophota bacterium]
MRKAIKETLVLFIKGGAIGVANIIPGVSGGTIAVILGIYDRLIESIARFFNEPDRRGEYVFFLARIFIAAAVAIVLLANLMDYLLASRFQETMFMFMGLIIGGIPAVVRSHGDMRIRTLRILAFVLGMIIVLGLSLIGKNYGETGASVVPDASVLDRGTYLMILIAGFLAGGAMIVPGVSGSFILVLLGQYALIISAIKDLAIRPLAVMALGAAAGILVFSKVIEACLEKIPSITYYFILGLIFASLYKIFPGLPGGGEKGLFCFGTFIAGTALSYLLSKISS